jgi:TolB-like protein
LRFLFGDHVLDTARRELSRGGEQIELEPQVFDLLVYLLRNRERVVSKDDLLASVWGGRIVSDATLDSRIAAARRAVGDSGAAQTLIRTFARKGVRFVGEVRDSKPAAVAPEMAAEPGRPELTLPDKPSIVVLPFANMSGDPEQEYFVDGMVEEIITALSRIRWLFVIARNSSFTYKGQTIDVRQVGRELGVRYVLEGSVRKARNRVRIAGQLIEAETGAHLWAERFDGSLEDVFDLQDEVAIRVAGVIEPTLQAAEIRRSSDRSTNDLTADDLYLRALALSFSWEKEAIIRNSNCWNRRSSVIPATARPRRTRRGAITISTSMVGPMTPRRAAGEAWISLGGHFRLPVMIRMSSVVLASRSLISAKTSMSASPSSTAP